MSNSLFHILNISRMDMLSRMNDLDVISNNVANINTIGYRGNRANFQEMLNGLNYDGIHQASSQLNMNQGAIKHTGNQLDVAIEGEGFFAVNLGGGKTGYTRNGQFALDSAGNLVSSAGYPLVWSGTVPPGAEEIEIQENGIVRVRVGDAWGEVGTVSLTRFPNASGLQVNGSNVLLETVASGTAQTGQPGTAQFGRLLSSSVENTNVNFADEITHLMSLQRGFQMSTRIFQATDTMISQAIHVRKV